MLDKLAAFFFRGKKKAVEEIKQPVAASLELEDEPVGRFQKWEEDPVVLYYLWGAIDGVDPDEKIEHDPIAYHFDRSSAEIHQFLDSVGAFVPAPDSYYLAKMTVKELKVILRSESLKLSGKKAEIIERILQEAPLRANECSAGRAVVLPTDECISLASDWKKEEKRLKQEARDLTFECLKEGQIRKAAEEVIRYESNALFPRGMGTGWGPGSADRLVDLVERILKCRPGNLKNVSDEDLQTIRLASAQSELWGSPDEGRNRLPEGIDTNSIIGMDPDIAANMVSSLAANKDRIERIRETIGDEAEVRILACGVSSCQYCQEREGNVYRLDDAPDLPHEGCTSGYGCRCTYVWHHGL